MILEGDSGLGSFSARIEQLGGAIDNRLVRATLQVARRSEDSLALELLFVGEDEQGQAIHERWEVTASGLAEHALSFEDLLPRFSYDHPRLNYWREAWVRLFYAAAPADAGAFEEDLRRAHDEWLYGPFSNSLVFHDIDDFVSGSGEVARGPLSLMERYALVLDLHRMRPTLLSVEPDFVPLQKPSLIFLLDWSPASWFVGNYVIAHSFKAQRVSEAAPAS